MTDLPGQVEDLDQQVLEKTSAEDLQRELNYLLEFDQLTRQRFCQRAFKGFQEGCIEFLPTYKYTPG